MWNSSQIRGQLEPQAKTSAGIYKINQGALREIQISIPPLDEQRGIVAELEQQLSLIDSLRSAVESAQRRSAALHQAILERAFRGELVPQDPADEPASVLLERIRAERAAAPMTRGERSTG
jgi:type I restriction enzyme S subunit